ncbi:amino acid adenylation domain-containing protein [Micromonospora peucetia]|uniref:non-ribosomal peptide synthetase n=1 Tax=Micromonospora peucetia TaxID=47871 RepID=UPI0022587E8B|nr:amino acid adenylation domain-containing protein [Micromonospora peucetia]MCX4386974.1 amino acid adenylation domain-containing protein [Micromonospora peucetia]
MKENALWTLERLLPGSGVNNVPITLVTTERLDVVALQATLDQLARRHRALRTRFVEVDGLPARVVAESAPVPLELVEAAADEAGKVCRAATGRPFDLAEDIPVRAVLVRCPDRDVICLCLHHLAVDAVSAAVLVEEFAALYPAMLADGRPPAELAGPGPAPELAAPTAAAFDFWHRHLADLRGVPAALEFGRPDPATPTFAGGAVTRRLSAAAITAMRDLRRACRATDNIVLLTLYYVLLMRHGAGRDVVVGVPVDLRDGAARRAVGYYMNTLPLRVDVAPERTFGELVREVRRLFVTAMDHADVSYEELETSHTRSEAAWWVPPFRHMFNHRPPAEPMTGGLDELAAEVWDIDSDHSRLDIELVVMREGDGVTLKAVYGSDVHDADDIAALLARYEAVLERLPAQIDRPVGGLDIWSAADRAVVDDANATAVDSPLRTVAEGIAAQVAAQPEATAIIDRDGVTWTYRDVAARTAGVAALLARAGVGKGAIVGLYAERDFPCAVAALGIWQTGAAYLPLDPDQPAARLAYELTDAQVSVLLVDHEPPPGVVPAGCRVIELGSADPDERDWPAPTPTPTDPAYVIYTSGSTGLPKGVVISHANLANVVRHYLTDLGVTSQDALLWLTTFAFDISALEVFLPLVAGARVVVADDAARSDGAVLLDLVERYDVSVLQATPTTWRLVVQEAKGRLRGRRVLCGGEPLPAHLARALLATGCTLWNVYGPTETTIWSTSALVTDIDAGVPVGRPIANTTVVIADGDGRPQPPGMPGEVCIGGDGVAIGYLRRPELTAQRFGELGGAGRFYRTGDVGRWRHDGTLELRGRTDRQVKLRGHRIELGEVEAVLEQHPRVSAAAVVLAGDPSADGGLVAFVRGASADIADDVWRFAKDQLASYAVPTDVVVLEAMPTTGNDKVDYPTLSAMAEQRTAARRAHSAEAAPVADGLVGEFVELWRSILKAPQLHEQSNFFRSGGHSLLAAKLAQQVTRSTGVSVSLSTVFSAPTPQQLAGFVLSQQSEGA